MPEALSLSDALMQATASVLEDMCFTALVDSAPTAPIPDALSAEVTFEGDARGSVRVQLTSDAAVAVASGFLGDDVAAVAEPSVTMVMLEVTNMICGRMLSLHAPSGSFSLGVPRPASGAEPSPVAACAFELETGRIRVAAGVPVEAEIQ